MSYFTVTKDVVPPIARVKVEEAGNGHCPQLTSTAARHGHFDTFLTWNHGTLQFLLTHARYICFHLRLPHTSSATDSCNVGILSLCCPVIFLSMQFEFTMHRINIDTRQVISGQLQNVFPSLSYELSVNWFIEVPYQLQKYIYSTDFVDWVGLGWLRSLRYLSPCPTIKLTREGEHKPGWPTVIPAERLSLWQAPPRRREGPGECISF